MTLKLLDLRKCILVAASVLTLGACNYNELKSRPPLPEKAETPNPELVVDFATVKSQVLDPACIRCHSGASPRAGIRLETFEQVFNIRDSIRQQVESGQMPPRPPGLTPIQKSLVIAWIDSGAPEKTLLTKAVHVERK